MPFSANIIIQRFLFPFFFSKRVISRMSIRSNLNDYLNNRLSHEYVTTVNRNVSKNLFTIPKLTYYAQIFQLDGIIDIQLSPTFSCLFYLLESILKFSIYLVQIEFPPYRGRKKERGELLLLTINSGSFVPFSFASKSFPKKSLLGQSTRSSSF